MSEEKAITLKHRDSVIDTNQLRSNEKRILAGVVAVLFFTVLYECGYLNYGAYFNVSVPEVTVPARKPQVRLDMLSKVDDDLKDLSGKMPQYRKRFEDNRKLIAEILPLVGLDPEKETASASASASAVLPAKENNEKATVLVSKVLSSLYEFLDNPVVAKIGSKPVPEMIELRKKLDNIRRFLKLPAEKSFEVGEIDFSSDAYAAPKGHDRNLFRYQ